MTDPVNRPAHYTSHPSGVECIQVTEHMNFNLGNAVKYLWRADEKGSPLEDLQKAAWYVAREIEKRQRASAESEAAVMHYDWCSGGCGGSCHRSHTNLSGSAQ